MMHYHINAFTYRCSHITQIKHRNILIQASYLNNKMWLIYNKQQFEPKTQKLQSKKRQYVLEFQIIKNDLKTSTWNYISNTK